MEWLPRRKPHILVTPLNKVKGQCAFLAGHGIQGETLARALHKCRGLILVPREYLAQRLVYLYNELGCTAKAKPSPKSVHPSQRLPSEHCSVALNCPRQGT